MKRNFFTVEGWDIFPIGVIIIGGVFAEMGSWSVAGICWMHVLISAIRQGKETY